MEVEIPTQVSNIVWPVHHILQPTFPLNHFLPDFVFEGYNIVDRARTMVFMQAAFFELFIVWNCRSEKRSVWRMKPHSNKFLLISVTASILLTASLCYVPIFQVMFRTVPLDLYDWIWVLLGTICLA